MPRTLLNRILYSANIEKNMLKKNIWFKKLFPRAYLVIHGLRPLRPVFPYPVFIARYSKLKSIGSVNFTLAGMSFW